MVTITSPSASIVDATPIPADYTGTYQVSCVDSNVVSPPGFSQQAFQYLLPAATTGLTAQTELAGVTASTPPALDGHVDPRAIIDIGVMNGNIPAPLVQFDEDDELFLTLTNVGMIQRPDLFEQHTIHFHGYPNASSFYDGVPDASVAINIGASFTYYYLAPDAGTYFWHCHITPPEHLQMGMVGQLHVRPRQDRVPSGGSLFTYLGYQNGIGLPTGTTADPRTVCTPGADILCSATMPAVPNTVTTARSATNPTSGTQGPDLLGNPQRYTYNDGDGSTAYDVEYPIQMHGFDPNFHFVGMTFNPEMFVDMKDKYFLLNGRSYPDTVAAGPQASMSTDGLLHYSQPMPALINIPVGGKALLRLVNLSVSEYHTLQSLGVPMKEIGFNAKLLRDQAGLNTEFYTNSITLGGGESLDVILDASDAGCGSTGCAATLYPPGSVFYLYTPQLDHLSNDAENFGGLMTEVHICNSVVPSPLPNGKTAADYNTFGNTCN
jgi:FtsP/CotA-like multicopper oxidase with cupredoxin domain